MNRENVIFGVSMDHMGVFGSPKQLRRVYPKQDFPFRFAEVLAVGTPKGLRHRIHALQDEGFQVTEIHGSPGPSDRDSLRERVYLGFVDRCMIPPDELAGRFADQELLFHTPEIMHPSVRATLLRLRPKAVWVENHERGIGGMAQAIAAAELLEHNHLTSHVMMDLCHFIGHEELTNGAFAGRWSQLITYLRAMTGRESGKIRGIHFPIGEKANDSLPLHRVSDTMLGELRDAIGPSVGRVIFENQSGGRLLLGMTPLDERYAARRNTGVLSRLQKMGLLKF
jgi:hypothetical protein